MGMLLGLAALGIVLFLIAEFIGMVFLLLVVGVCLQTGGLINYTIAGAVLAICMLLKMRD